MARAASALFFEAFNRQSEIWFVSISFFHAARADPIAELQPVLLSGARRLDLIPASPSLLCVHPRRPLCHFAPGIRHCSGIVLTELKPDFFMLLP